MVRAPFTFSSYPDSYIRESPYRGPLSPVLRRKPKATGLMLQSRHSMAMAGYASVFRSQSRHSHPHHRDRGECGKGRPRCPDLGRFWIPCCGYARPHCPGEADCSHNRDRAGIGRIFKAPLGGAVLAAEVLYTRDFESDAIIPAFLASVIGYAIFGFLKDSIPFLHSAQSRGLLPRSPCSFCWVSYVRLSGSSILLCFTGAVTGLQPCSSGIIFPFT